MLTTADPIAASKGVIAAALLCAGAAAAQPSRPPLPDSAYAPAAQLGVPGANDMLAHWIATELRGAAEPTLYRSDSSRAAIAYRLTTLGGWGGAGVLRLERRAATWTLVRKQTVPVGSGQDRTRSIRTADSLPVPTAAAARLVAVIMNSDRWRRPAPACRQGFDGYEVLLEARDEAGYAFALCWVPDEATAPANVSTIRAFEELARQTFEAVKSRTP
jgi:hypothetical protein